MYTSPSGKSYIGQTWNEKRRKREHRLALGTNGGALLHKAIKKYGYENIAYSILHEGIETQKEMNALEEKEIILRNTMVPNGYNLSSGGQTEYFLSDESKKKISDSSIGHEVAPETRKKISEKLKGKSYISPEGRAAISKRHKGRILNEKQLECLQHGRTKPRTKESMARSIKALTEYKLTDEDRAKRKARTIGEKNPFYGKKHTEETKRKISETKKQKRITK